MVYADNILPDLKRPDYVFSEATKEPHLSDEFESLFLDYLKLDFDCVAAELELLQGIALLLSSRHLKASMYVVGLT